MRSKRFRLYYYEDGVKLTKYPLIALFVERSKENWQSKMFGITILSCIFITASFFILKSFGIENVILDTIHILAYVWYIIAYLIFIKKNDAVMEAKLKELEELFNSESGKKEKNY